MIDVGDALSRANANSPFLAGLIERLPELVAQLEKGDFEGALAKALSIAIEGDTAATLRKRRQGVALVTAIADLAGVWDLGKVTRSPDCAQFRFQGLKFRFHNQPPIEMW